MQKLVRAAFGNNNVDTCARVCHSPTGYGLKTDLRHLGRHAGFRLASSKTDVIMVIGANPTDGHPVFASRMKKRLRQGAKLIVIDPRRIDLVRIAACRGRLSPAAEARHQRRRAHRARPCHRHRGPGRRGLRPRALRLDEFEDWAALRRRAAATARRRSRSITGVARGRSARRGAALSPPAATARSTTASASPSTARARPRSWRSPTSPWRPAISAGPASA